MRAADGTSVKGSRGARAGRLVALVLINLGAVLVALFAVSEWFIARKAATTLLYQPNPHYRHDLLPNQVYRRDGFEYRVGPHGLRGEPPVMPKPAGVLRIAVMGGSSVFDFRVGRSWPERLQDELRGLGFTQVEVFNAGVPGFSTREVLPFYARKIAAYEPDVVLLYAGWNDVKIMKASQEELTLPEYPRLRPGARDPYAFLTAPRPLRNVYALQLLMQKLELRAGFVAENRAAPSPPTKEAGAAPLAETSTAGPSTRSEGWAKTPGVQYFRGNVGGFIEAVRSRGARPMVVAEATLHTAELPASERARIAYHFVGLDHEGLLAITEAEMQVARQVAEGSGVPWLDPRPGISGQPAYFHDHVHLTEAGSAALAMRLAGPLAELLQRGAEP